MPTIQTFRKGVTIPEGAKFLRTEEREVPGSDYERVVAPRSFLAWIGITETVGRFCKVETVYIYEVPDHSTTRSTSWCGP